MTHPLYLTLVDQQIAHVAALAGEAQRQAATKLALRVAARDGRGASGVHCVGVEGVLWELLVVRGEDGAFRVLRVGRVEMDGRQA